MCASAHGRGTVIETQSRRSADELRLDVHESHDRFLSAVNALESDAWSRELVWGNHDRRGPAAVIPFLRRTEVEVHHIDLDLDYTLAHWPEDFVEALLDDIADEASHRDDLTGRGLTGADVA